MTSNIAGWASTAPPIMVSPTTPANYTDGTRMLDDLPMDSNFVWLLCSLIFAISWVMYITYYNSRLTGYIITKIVNRLFISDGYFKIGSLTLNVLSGKIMFRDFVYITHDYTIRVQDGYLIFRWWRSYVPKDVSEDLSHSDTRLSVMLNGFELHVYNRGAVYASLERTFGLEPSLFPPGSDEGLGRPEEEEQAMNDENTDRQNSVTETEERRSRQRPEAAMARTWRDLIPVIKVDICSGRVVFGNRLVPTSLSITVEESHWVYSTKPAASTLDKLMHFVKCWAENARVMLAPSPKYTGMLDEPPRYMGEGFVLMATNYMELYAYMDEPGLVPEQPVLVRLANGDIVESAPPMWGIDIKCGKGTDFSYGPWADRQREHLFKFFYPNDYQAMKITRAPKAGDKRQMHTFDIRLSMLNEATIDVLFSKNKETNAVHINVGAGSYLEITLPWIVLQNGCETKITGQLLHLEATTSLQYRDLVSSETLEFSVNCHYPLIWNHHQSWEMSLTGCKATINLVYGHKNFFSDLVNDWSTKHRPDLMSFVPYTWRFGLTLKHCEVIIPCNMFNWVDCSSAGGKQKLENTRLSLCAHLFHLSFDLPFEQFLPVTIPLNFQIQGESIDLSLFVPENHTSRNILLALDKYAKVLSKEGTQRQKTENIPKWRNICTKISGWVDFWWIPIGAISITWVYHPSPQVGPQPQADISTPVKEELLLSPMRFPHGKKRPHRSPESRNKFDPTSLSPDKVSIDLEIGPSVLLLYGTALRNFVHLKENIFGDDQNFTDMYHVPQNVSSGANTEKSDEISTEDFDFRYYRPLEVDVSVIMHDIQAHLLKFCSNSDPPCPIILVERFGFEMKKRYEQTELQLLLSPSVLLVSDSVNRGTSDSLQNGRLALASLQLRGHAMFSDFERSLDEDTVEYGWLLELQMGKLSGKLTTPQLHQIVVSLETLIYLISDSENEMSSPHYPTKVGDNLALDIGASPPQNPVVSLSTAVRQSLSNTGPQSSALQALLQPRNSKFHSEIPPVTNLPPKIIPLSRGPPKLTETLIKNPSTSSQKPTVVGPQILEPDEKQSEIDTNNLAHKLKYKFTRVAVDAIDLWLVESGAALQLWMSPIRVANCNLHGKQVGSGLTCVVFNAMLRQLVCQNNYKARGPNAKELPEGDTWLEVAALNMGTLVIEAILSPAAPENQVLQHRFLKQHDDRTRRLWFLWGGPKCGCIGGCSFFGNNKNGQKFFKPSKADLQDGVNIAAFKINDPGKDLGYGQSLLHEGQLVFRTPPYTSEILLHETLPKPCAPIPKPTATSTAPQTGTGSPKGPNSASPVSSNPDRRVNRRFSYTLTRNSNRDVPYARLVEQPTLPAKLDSDSKLHTDKKTILNVPDSESGPKNSVSDSKLAVDYFNSTPEPVTNLVNVSESHHSLSTRLGSLGSEERLRKEVQRTISMSSENQSEAFFSADEDLNPSRTSSLRHSIIGSGSVLNHQSPGGHSEPKVETGNSAARKKFASDLSIVADRFGGHHGQGGGAPSLGGGSGPTSLTECVKPKLSTHRSDHEIHTPEHRSFGYQGLHRGSGAHHGDMLDEDRRTVHGLGTPRKVSTATNRSLSPRPPEFQGLTEDYALRDLSESVTCDSSDSRSLSSNSYASAVASQEDMTLVDLHMQLNRQICDSPLLMSSYVGHLSLGRCPNWSGGPHNLDGASAGGVSLQAAQPVFQRADDGGKKLIYVGGRFVPQMDIVTEGFTLLKMIPGGGPSVWESENAEVSLEGDGGLSEEELISWRSSGENGSSRTSIIVRLQGSLDISATPLLLECLQRYIDTLTPVLSSLHPLTVVTNLHAACVSQVEAQNTLKRDQDVTQRIGIKTSSTYEEFVRTQIQMCFVLPKVNITLLQASIVEEIISFSALDNIKDLTCVSLFAVCFENITARFHRGKKARELLQIFQRPAVGFTGGKKLQKASKSNEISPEISENVYIETSEKQQEEFVVSLNIGKIHAQLRRLKNDSSILNDAVITAIPAHHSKVVFTCQKVSQPSRGLEFYLNPNSGINLPSSCEELLEDRLGFIMFEAGLEGAALKVVKRSQFEKIENPNQNSAESDVYFTENNDSASEISAQTLRGGAAVLNTGGPQTENAVLVKDTNNSNTSSCVIEFKSVWFNFAAPPRAPITRKLDYTRLDWNLLSTASPAINAWMQPANRFAMRVVNLVRGSYRRSTGVIACLMAEALDVQQIHNPVRSKYGKLTTLASTLQEDPSCQLCTVLERFVVTVSDVATVEASLRDSELPQLSTLRQGVIVLSRQWKNVLYTPLLLDHNYKTRFVRPLNVTFAVPDLDEEMNLTDGEASGNDDPDVTDECAMLLRTEALLKPKGGPTNTATVPQPPSGAPLNSPRVDNTSTTVGPTAGPPQAVAVVSSGIESVLTSPSPPAVPQRRHRRALPPGAPPASLRASVVFPMGVFGSRAPAEGIQPGSDPSVNSQSSPDLPGSPGFQGASVGPKTATGGSGGPQGPPMTNSTSCEDLYSWMAKQQEYVRSQQNNNHSHVGGASSGGGVDSQGAHGAQRVDIMQREINESKVNTLATDSSGEYGGPQGATMAGVSLYPMQDSLRLLDAHMIFQPLLSSLGVMPQQMVAPATQLSSSGAHQAPTAATGSSLDSLGSNLSLVGSMEQMRIDIVVSEHGKGEKRSSSSKKASPHLDFDETPAFICERVSIELEVDKMADMTVDDMIRTRNVLYISRGQLKKHTSTALNFSIAARQISQQVNMPLLRLLHQITNMYQNVKETQNELREQRPRAPPGPETPPPILIAKNTSSSASDLQDVTLVDPKPIPLSLKVSDPSSIVSHLGGPQKPVLSPSASVRSRPQSFAQKLRSTGKSVKGYMNLNEGGTPIFNESPLTVASDKSVGPPGACWKTVYHLLDLYATMPETKTITHRFSMAQDISEHYKGTRKYDLLTEAKSAEDIELGGPQGGVASTPLPQRDLAPLGGERTRLIVFGVARIHRTKLLATLSGLKLEAEITSLHSSLTWRKKSKPHSLEFSLTGQVGRTMIVLIEGEAPNQQTVVKVTVGKSQALYSSISKRNKDKNSGLLTVGAVNIDIPQHPVALHGMVTRGSKQLSSTLQELRVTRTASRMSRNTLSEHFCGPPDDQSNRENIPQASPNHFPSNANPENLPNVPERPPENPNITERFLQPLVMQFSVILQSLSITAALLPSLQAQYKMDQVNSTGVTGSKAKFTIDLPHHSLSFTTKLLPISEPNLPSEASIALPAVHVSAEYVPESSAAPNPPQEGLVLKKGGYLSAHADIGVFEHSLTTDLLNHLVFVQKVFMKEVNEVVQKVYGGERPVRLWTEEADSLASSPGMWSRILFSLVIRIQRIQLTATTAGSSAVRLETGAVALELSNRVQNISGGESVRLFGKAQVDINLCLGQLTRNPMFEEAEPDFQQFAFFNTRVGLRNAFQDEMVDGENKEVVLITLKRPLVYIQPLAVDKAILVWLNYKNAYDYWNEKRANLNKEVLTATQQVFEKVPFGQFTSQLSTAVGPSLGTLFLQLTVDDMGICLPLNPLPLATWGPTGARSLYDESRGAVVITLESTSIAACSSGSLVSKGRFANLCLRFADDFDPSLDDWKPDMSDSAIMNLCVVTEGTYEVCSRTIAAKNSMENAKWFLNVTWQMEGVDINLDVNVGKQLSALGHTLTMLTGAEDGPARSLDDDSDDVIVDVSASQESLARGSGTAQTTNFNGIGLGTLTGVPSFVLDPNIDAKKRSKLIEKEMSEQAKIINDLRSLGASHGTIEQEMRRLHELEALVFKDFRRDMIQKLRRQSVKASSIKGKLGLGSRSSAYRSKSFIIPSPTPERHLDIIESPEDVGQLSASFESSPRSGPSRTASLRVRNGNTVNSQGPRVTFSDRQNSLPSAESDISLCGWNQDSHMDIDGEKVELRRKIPCESFENVNLLDHEPKTAHVTQQNLSQIPQKPQEPNIDFELDVKVLINSGKCVLHTKDFNKDEEHLKMSRMRKDRSCSAGLLEFPLNSGSPDAPRRNKDAKGAKEPSSAKDSTRGRGPTGPQAPHPNQLIDLTIFHIPGMEVKVHYESKVIQDDSENNWGLQDSAPTTVDDEMNANDEEIREIFSEDSVTDETVNNSSPSSSKSSNFGITNPNYLSELNINLGGKFSGGNVRKPGVKKASLFAWMTLQSIPEETIISPHILEFLEQTLEPIPSKTISGHSTTVFTSENPPDSSYPGGTYVYTSFPVDVIVYFHMQPSTFRFSCLPVSRVECMLQLPSLDLVFSSKRAEEAPQLGETPFPATAVGGLSVTGCLADFSVYIFHPYGGKKSGLKEAQWSPLADSERKDSLSVNVEFVKFHLSRSRKLNFNPEPDPSGKTSSDHSRAVIRFSTIIDIGSASFKYDMRRLTEILAFPKAWYRRSIVRRLFLGDLSGIGNMYSDENEDTIPEDEPVPSASSTRFSGANELSKSAPTGEKSPLMAREKLKLSFEGENKLAKNKKAFSNSESALLNTSKKHLHSNYNLDTPSPGETKQSSAWETLVLFAVNFTKLNVHMNMGNVMGNVTWQTKAFRSEGRLSIGSTGHKNMYLSLGLSGSTLDAKGGIVGGTIELSNIDTYIHIREEPHLEPDHTIGLKLQALELRLDYMGTSVLMCRVSSLDVTLRDEWRLSHGDSAPTRRPATIFVHGVLGWDQLQLMISKSSTADLIKMYHKLEEFFSQQFNSSKRVFSRLGPNKSHPQGSLAQRRLQAQLSTTSSIAFDEARHHRHWQKALRQIAGLQLSTVQYLLPSTGTVLGGTVELRGQNISLACFHGINFKTKSWALFSLREPCISFNTESQEIPSMSSNVGHDVHVVQTLTCSLGLSTYKTQHSMATVCKVSRNLIFPPQFKTLQEWFHYAFASSHIDEVDRFPSLEHPRTDTPRGKLTDPNHTREIIFALPSLQLHLKTEHLQTASTPDLSGDKPTVECSFVTEFEDHIFVTVDAEAFFFLHDLITSYVKEKERLFVSSSGIRASSPDPEKLRSTPSGSSHEDFSKKKGAQLPSSGSFSPDDMFTKDWRSYQCKTWHMEPTVRLLSWAGKSIEPYGIDYILQKLGFSHARTTIPKWLQRGFMDPLDKVLAVLTLRMVAVIKEEKSERENKKTH